MGALGGNGMFGKSDATVLLNNMDNVDGGNITNTPTYTQNAPYEKTLSGFTTEAMFSGEGATNLMDSQGYEFREKTSFSNIRTINAVNQMTPNGGSISVQIQIGTEVVTSQTYVRKGMEQNSSKTLFETTDKINGSSSIFKTNYSYSEPSSFMTLMKVIFKIKDTKDGNYSQDTNYVKKVYGWDNVTDKSLIKYKNK